MSDQNTRETVLWPGTKTIITPERADDNDQFLKMEIINEMNVGNIYPTKKETHTVQFAKL